jgi:nucleotide-binding universal stress UspA family protein
VRPLPTPEDPLVVAYDGSPASEMALVEAAALLAPRRAVIVTVWKEGIGLRVVDLPEQLPPAPLDARLAVGFDRAMAERARRLAEHGAALAREAGLEAESLAVAEEAEVPVSDTVVDVAEQRGAAAIAVGSHRHGGAIGRISRDVIRRARCPVLVRGPARSRSISETSS